MTAARPRLAAAPHVARAALPLLLVALLAALAGAQTRLPTGFVEDTVLRVGHSPASMKFAPDGRLFVGRRITGELMVATYDRAKDSWTLNPRPWFVCDIPKDASGRPARHRSSGLRSFAFDPDFARNGYVYVYHMNDRPRHNRVVRVQQDPADPTRALPDSETLLLDLPFNSSGSSGSHNGGGIEFGADGMLYVTTGDGWSGGDPVQSLATYTGKVFRIGRDGSIPTDGPFFGQAQGALRAIWCLGCRNPFVLTKDPRDGALYISETTGANKADTFRVARGANYGHQGYGGIGTRTAPWINLAATGGKLTCGGAVHANPFPFPIPQPWPPTYRGQYYAVFWGSNGSTPGTIARVDMGSAPSGRLFAANIRGSAGKPITTRLGPDGNLYYLVTSYEVVDGEVRRIRWAGGAVVDTPVITPPGGRFTAPTPATITVASPTGATIRFTLDGSTPTVNSALYTAPVRIDRTTTVKARGFAASHQPSAVAEATFTFGSGNNVPPVALAGPDVTVPVDRLVLLNGSASYDPDGDNAKLQDNWVQTAGPVVPDFDGGDFVSPFTPRQLGRYVFRLDVSDGIDTRSDEVVITVVPCVDDVLDGLEARWLMDEGSGNRALDSSKGAANADLVGAVWSPRTPHATNPWSLEFDGVDDVAVVREDLSPGGSALTLSAWIHADDFAVGDARIVSRATGTAADDHLFMLSTLASGGGHVLRGRLRVGASTTTLVGQTRLQAGRWHHVAMVYDGAALRLHVDAVEDARVALAGTLAAAKGVATALGNQPPGAGSRPFDGRIDDVRLYGRALTPAELAILATPTVGQPPAACNEARDLGQRGPGAAWLSFGGRPRDEGPVADLRLTGLPGKGVGALAFGSGAGNLRLFGGVLVPAPLLATLPVSADDDGQVLLRRVPRGATATGKLVVQGVFLDAALPGGVGFSNGIEIAFPF